MFCFLWTEVAAAWAQAIFSVVAIVAAWKIADRSRKLELEDRTEERRVRGRGLALQLLQGIAIWYERVRALTQPSDRGLVDALNNGVLGNVIGPQVDLVRELRHVDEIGDVGIQIQNAVFAAKWLVENAEPARAACHGDNAERDVNERIWHGYLDRVDTFTKELKAILDGIDTMFAK